MNRKRLIFAVILLLTATAVVISSGEFFDGPAPRPRPGQEEPISVPIVKTEEPEVAPEEASSGISVQVRVVDETGHSVPGANVEVLRKGRLIDSGTIGSFGAVWFRNVPPGYYTTVRATAMGLVPDEARLDDLDPRDVVLRLRPGIAFSGRVLAHEGLRPVEGAEVTVSASFAGRLRTETAEDGTFTFAAVPEHRLADVDVEAGKDGWASYQEIILAPGLPFEVVLPAVKTLSGQVVDEAGNAVPGLTIESIVGIGLVSIHGFCADGSRRDGLSAVTDGEGRFALEGLTRSGGLEVRSEAWRVDEKQGYWRWDAEDVRVLVVPRDLKTPAVEVETPRPGIIRGRVEVADGPVVAEVHARREVPFGERSEYMDWNSAWCRPDGSFEITGLAEAVYPFSVEAVGCEELHVMHAKATAEGTVLGVLRPPPLVKLHGRVVDEAGAPISSATVGKRPVNPDGTFTVKVVAECENRVTFSAPGYAPRSLKSPDEGEWVARLGPANVVEGVILDVKGRPIPSVPIYASPAEQRNTKSDLAGRFRLTYREPGEYSVHLSAAGHHFLKHLPVKTGDRKVVLQALSPTTLAGRVVTEAGAPIRRARIRAGNKSAESDTDGRFRMEGLLGASFSVFVELRDPDRAVRPVDEVQPGTEDLILRAERGLSISGRVLFPDGRPAAEVLVEAESVGHLALNRARMTDKDGRFEIRGLLPGEWKVICECSGGDGDVDDWWWAEKSALHPGARDISLTLARYEDKEEEEPPAAEDD